MSWHPDQAVILSLPQATERRERMTAMMPRLAFPAEIVDAVDGNTVDVPATWRSSPEAYGNAQSHRRALAQATGSIVVLEDDAAIQGDFRSRLETVVSRAPDWELIMLGGEHIIPPAPYAAGVVRVSGMIRSIGYIARGRGITATIHAIDTSQRHWDNKWMQAMQTIRTFAPDPLIVKPTGAPSSIPDSTPYR